MTYACTRLIFFNWLFTVKYVELITQRENGDRQVFFYFDEVSVSKHVLPIYRKTRYTARETYCVSTNYNRLRLHPPRKNLNTSTLGWKY